LAFCFLGVMYECRPPGVRMKFRAVKAFLCDAVAPSLECSVIEFRTHINSNEARALEQVGILKSALAKRQPVHQLERHLHFLSRHRLRKRNHDTHARLGGILRLSRAHLLDGFLYGAGSQSNIYVASGWTRYR